MEEKSVWTDEQILLLFKEPNQKEAAFTQLVSNYQERLYWHIRRMVVAHHDTTISYKKYLLKLGGI